MALKDRLKQARKQAAKSQKDVAEGVGITQPTLSQLESGTINSSSFLPAIARFLNVDVHWLQAGHGDMHPAQQNQENDYGFNPPKDTEFFNVPDKGMPVISWVQAGDYTPVASSDLTNVIEWLPYDPRAGKNGFALVVKGVSMEPEFKPDDRIYVNPTFQIDELNTGALVVMACDGDSEATFKELVVEGGRMYLRALNPDWHEKIMPIDHNCRLVGKVVGKYVIYK